MSIDIKEVIYDRRWCHVKTLMHIKGLFKFLNWGDGKDTVKPRFNGPKIISCQTLTIRVRNWVITTSERSKL